MKRLTLMLIAGLMLVPGFRTEAQEPTLSRVYFLTPAAGNGPAVRAALADHTEWLRREGDAWGWSVFGVVGGHDVGDFILRSGGHTWADFDERDRGFGARALQRFQTTVAPLLESIRMEIEQDNLALTRPGAGDEDYAIFHITDWQLTPAGAGPFNTAIEQMLGSYEEAGVGYEALYFNILVGPEQPRVRRVRLYRDWSDFSNAPDLVSTMTESYGENGMAEILNAYGASVESSKDFIIQIYPEMTVEGAM